MEYLKEQISNTEKDINSANQLMVERQKLEEEIENTKQKIELQKKEYDEEINRKDSELRKLVLEAQTKEENMQELERKESAV